MRCQAIGFLILVTSAICFAQNSTPPLVTTYTDEPIRADDPRTFQAHTEIQALVFHMTERWNAHDLAGFMEGLWKSNDFLLVVNAEEVRGWTEVYAAYQRGYPDPNTMGTLVSDHLETQLVSPDVALVFNRWTAHLKGGRVLGTSTMVVRKFSDGWKIISDHSTTLEP